jgi:hypothetical protein
MKLPNRSSKQRRPQPIAAESTRRSKRSKKTIATYAEEYIHMPISEHHGSYKQDESDDDLWSDTDEVVQFPVRSSRQLREESKSGQRTTEDLVTVAAAKTGRSRCRLCMDQISTGEIRVGMKAWIMGRQSMTWQHPNCFVRNMVVEEAANARTKCKITGESFATGDLKLGFCSHTSKLWVSMASAPTELGKVLVINDAVVKLSELEGFEALPEAKQSKVVAMLEKAKKYLPDSLPNVDPAENEPATEVLENTKQQQQQQQQQPALGRKTGATGKVKWQFGGHICFGVLIASKETKTHCYARTHKGNTKILSKGKGSWSLV